MGASETSVIKQHLIDPVICIRCNTCEATCPVGAITHDDRNYVVDADKCNLCMACVPPCPTGSIDNWRDVPKVKAYSLVEQFSWDDLPEPLPAEELASSQSHGLPNNSTVDSVDATIAAASKPGQHETLSASANSGTFRAAEFGSTLPPWSAAHAFTNLYGPKSAQKTIKATVTGNLRVTDIGKDYDTHHIVLDFGNLPFPVLEGQSVGIIPPGTDSNGRAHFARQYSIASARNGERQGHNNVSLTIKRVLEDYAGKPVRGVASNYMCDLKIGDAVEVVGPFGASFLMPNHPRSNIIMICTGTGSAPMRAMTEWRRRLRHSGKFEGGKLMLFFGARSAEELPYFGPLNSLPKDFIDINLAFSRTPGQPKRYVQDAMRERAADLAPLIQDPNAYFFVCGLKAMEEGVVMALRDIAQANRLDWSQIGQQMKSEARLHLETY